MFWGLHIWGIKSKNNYLVLGFVFVFTFWSTINAFSQVGINTTDPQEKLHIAGTTGTMRVESLNYQNDFNPGDEDGNGNMDDNTVPLYVDEHGDFTLQVDPLENSGAEDFIIPFLNNGVTLNATDATGCKDRFIISYVLPPVSRPTLLQVKYNISHEISLDGTVSLSDGLARRVDNFILVTPDPDPTDNVHPREYGPSSRTYTSASVNSIQGPFFNGHTTYIKLIPPDPPNPQTFTLLLYGRVCSDLNSSGGSLQTYVEFTGDMDFMFLKLY